eukprot:GHVO01064812.1.p3 GENE.GHVO01064812.1~~GHVO01064812.1.p3  ORF type:complete len:109 (+),score=8.86 GHVO01064812.1:262-588(+)
MSRPTRVDLTRMKNEGVKHAVVAQVSLGQGPVHRETVAGDYSTNLQGMAGGCEFGQGLVKGPTSVHLEEPIQMKMRIHSPRPLSDGPGDPIWLERKMGKRRLRGGQVV